MPRDMRHVTTQQRLRQRGFDRCRKRGPYIHVGCSQCAALVVNGVACHERGCPNDDTNRRRGRR